MIVFTSLLWIWKGETAGRWYFVTIPEAQSAEIKAHSFEAPRGFGSVRVEAAIDNIRTGPKPQTVTWRTSVFPLNSGGYVLPVKAEIRRRAGIAAGDEVTIKLKLP